MEINNTSRKKIKELAEFIALEHNTNITPLEKIVEAEDLSVFYDNYGTFFDGMLIFDNSFYIHLNTALGNKEGSKKGRFTLAHELGHYFINNHRIGLQKGILKPHPSKNNNGKHEKIEREADYFASCLLMPEIRFKKDCFKRKFDFSLIESLSNKYNVSLTAAAIRFADIGTHPIMIVYTESNKVVWKWSSNDFPFKYLNSQNSVVPIDSLAGSYFNSGKGKKGADQLWIGDWFNCYNHEDSIKKMHEFFIPYKNKGLSILWED